MVLPEYLVEFQYETSPTSVKLARSTTSPAAGKLESLLSSASTQQIITGLEQELRCVRSGWMGSRVACTPCSHGARCLSGGPFVLDRGQLVGVGCGDAE